MTAYPGGYQLGHNHVFFDPSQPHEQRVGVQYHEAGGEDAVPRSTPRYFPPPDTTTPHLGHSQRYSDVNSILTSRTVSRGDCSSNDEEEDGDDYGLHYYYGKTWNSGTSDPVNFDARVPAWTTPSTATNSTSSAEWSTDSVHRPLPYNQIPMQRPPELYEPNTQHVPTLGVLGHSHTHSSAPASSYAPLQSNGPAEAVTEYPMSRLSRLPQGILPSYRYNVNNPHPHPPPYPHPRQRLGPLVIYQPTQEELDERAHAPVPPEKLSSYSELSPHIEFMERLKFEESLEKTKESRNPAHKPVMDMDASIIPPSSVISSATSPKRPFNADSTAAVTATVTATATANPVYAGGPAPGVQAVSIQTPITTATPAQVDLSSSPSFIPPPAKKRRRSKNAVADSTPDVEPPSHRASESSSNPNLSPEENGGSSPTISSNGIKYIKSDPRKPSLACTFCRERKISCGRPPAGSQDVTCNQCARRSFKCEYITEIPSPPKTTTRRRRKPSLASTSPPK